MPKRILKGKVISNSSEKTIVVLVERQLKHPLYHKIVRRSKKYMAHDEENRSRIGDVVRIIESRPFSKRKTWELLL